MDIRKYFEKIFDTKGMSDRELKRLWKQWKAAKAL